MRSDTFSFRCTRDLSPEVKRLSKKGGFINESRFLMGLVILAWHDDRRGQVFTGPSWVRDLANAKPKDQDYAIKHMKNWPDQFPEMLKMMKKIDSSKGK